MRDFYYLNTIKTTLILLATLLAVAKSQAANPPISSQDDQNSRRALQENQRQLNKQLQPKPTKGPAEEGLKEVTAEGNPVLQESAKCLPITGVYVTDTTLLSEKDFAKLTPIANDCILAEDVNRLIRELTGLYISKGYVTARILLLQVKPLLLQVLLLKEPRTSQSMVKTLILLAVMMKLKMILTRQKWV